MILVYMGNGKGKTSACVGQALRAHGQGLRVAFVQFMKRPLQPLQAGEQRILQDIFGSHYYVGGLGFFRHEDERPAHTAAAEATLAHARDFLPQVDIVILDEILYALSAGLLTREPLIDMLMDAQTRKVHVLLSGRGLPDWLAEYADLITEMCDIKHPWQQGIPATKGIDF